MKLAEDNLPKPVKVALTPFPKEFTDALQKFEINKAADFAWSRIQALDQRITKEEPFKVAKTNPARGRALIAELVHELAAIN